MANILKIVNKIPFAPVVASTFALLSAILVFAIPDWKFAQIITASGLPTLISAARPPLGDTARALVALGLGAGIGAMLWLGLSSLRVLMKRGHKEKARGARIGEVIRESNQEPRSPQRRPIFAERDLGAPFMSDEVIAKAAPDLIFETAPAPSAELMPALAPAASPYPETPDLTARWAAPQPDTPPAPIKPDAPMNNVPGPEIALPPIAGANEPSIAALMARLETALDRRQQQGKSQPAGDIASLRQALGGVSFTGR